MTVLLLFNSCTLMLKKQVLKGLDLGFYNVIILKYACILFSSCQ